MAGGAVIDHIWECPKCGIQVGAGSPGTILPPTCRMGHDPTEMEQKIVEKA